MNEKVDGFVGTKVAPPFGHDYLLLIAMSHDRAANLPFFRHLFSSGQLPSMTDPAEELLMMLQTLTPDQAALAILPFVTVRK